MPAKPRPGDIVITPKLDPMFRSALDALAVLGDSSRFGQLKRIVLVGLASGSGVIELVELANHESLSEEE